MATADYWDEADLKALLAGGLVREDVMDKIHDISQIALPFSDAIGEDTASQSFSEWTIDELPAPDATNFNVSGADAAGNDASGGTRVGNHCANSDKSLQVTHRAQASDTVGRENERAYHIMRAQEKLRRDVEHISLLNNASVADDGDSVAGEPGGFDAWLETNVEVGALGAVGGFNTTTKIVDAATPGTGVALAESTLSDAIESCYNNNGEPTIIMGVPASIKGLARFLFGSATVATPTANVRGDGGGVAQTSQGFINVMVTDFGFTMDLVPNRLQPFTVTVDATVFGIDPSMVAIAFLERYRTYPLGKAGTADKDQVNVDWTLKVYNEKAHFSVRDVEAALPVLAVPA